jgi:tRNA A-37 threonylcarbamoyl transferase component Bud32
MLARLFRNWGKTRESVPAEADNLLPGGAGPSSFPVPSSPEFQPGDLIMDRYRVEQVMSGSMGNVYISEHLGWAVKMAIKSPRQEVLADREGMKRILKEANSWIRMGMHPNIATCYYVLAIRKIPHLFIEYVDGGSLADWLKTGRCRDLRTALSLAVQFCHGMEFTHEHGIIHRDIKPANVLITRNSLLKITDFGILLTTADRDGALIDSGEEDFTVGFRGTPGFASPEQFNNAHAVDRRTDIFSFGICLWLMLCGTKPFQKNSIRTAIPQPVALDPRTPFPQVLTEILKKCVAFEPDDRFQDFVSLRQALDEAYAAVFKASCPYAVLPRIDMRADSLNNRAVSLFELNKAALAEEFLLQALEADDVLPEAIHNLILLRWWRGQLAADRATRKVEAAMKRLGQLPLLLELRERLAAAGHEEGASGKPELRLCQPQNSLAVFRHGQLHQSVGRNMLDHLENGNYAACQQVFLTAWRNDNFKKDKAFNSIYERLLGQGRKQKVESAQRVAIFSGSGQPVDCLAYVPFSRKVVAGSHGGRIVIWDLVMKKKLSTLGDPDLPVQCLAANPKGGDVAAGIGDGTISVWSVDTFTKKASYGFHAAPVTSLAYSSDGRWLFSGAGDGSLVTVHLPTGREIRYQAEGGAVRALIVGDQGRTFVTGSEDGKIRFWQTGGQECLRVVEAHGLAVCGLTAMENGSRFASAGGDRLLKIWDTAAASCLMTIEAHEEAVTSVMMLADGAHLVSGCEDDIIKVWNMEDGDCRLVLDGRGDGIISLATGPKPHMFFAGRADGAVLLWMTIYSLAFEQAKP